MLRNGMFLMAWWCMVPLIYGQENAPPKNDDFDSDVFLGDKTSYRVEGSNLGASRETGEVGVGRTAYGDASVWWTWTAPYSSPTRVWVNGSNLVVNVYTGESLDSLSSVNEAFGRDDEGWMFLAEAGVTYRLLVAEADSSPAFDTDFTLQLLIDPTLNLYDLFESPLDLGGAREVSASISNIGATFEDGEMNNGFTNGGSAWARWLAPDSGWYGLRAYGAGPSDVAGVRVYGGSDPAKLNDLASGFGSAYWFATEGVAYSFQVVGERGEDVAELYVRPRLKRVDVYPVVGGLGNDSKVRAVVLESSKEGEQAFSNAGVDGAAWWSWQAPEDGVWAWSTSDTQVAISVYDSRGVLVANREWKLIFEAKAGEIYSLEFREEFDQVVEYTIQWRQLLEATNDAFEVPRVLSGSYLRKSVGYLDATLEPGEQLLEHGNGGGSLWWEWTASADSNVVVSAADSAFDAAVGVYTGDFIDALELVMAGGLASEFMATAGTRYRIVVGATDSTAEGELVLELSASAIEPDPGLRNDDFANSLVLASREDVRWHGEVGGATLESDEAVGDAAFEKYGSRWWRWECPETGVYEIDTGDSPFAIFTGTVLAELEEILVTTLLSAFMGPGTTLFPAVEGEVYHFAFAAEEGTFLEFGIDGVRENSNDSFDGRVRLGTVWDGFLDGSNVGTGHEEGEPEHEVSPAELKTVWWEWKAPETGDLTFSLSGNLVTGSGERGQAALAMYRGTSLDSLSLVRTLDDGGPVEIRVEKGEVYQFAVYGRNGAIGTLFGVFEWVGVAINDDFDERIDLDEEVPVRFGAGTVGATAEPSEPRSASGETFMRTLWWQWRAPSSGEFTWHVRSAAEDTRRMVFRGSHVDSLERASTESVGNLGLTFSAVAGQLYQLFVDVPSAEVFGPIDFQLEEAREVSQSHGFDSALPFVGESMRYDTFWSGTTCWKWRAPKRGWFRVRAVGEDVVWDPDVTLYVPSRDGTAISPSRVAFGGGVVRHFAEEGDDLYFSLSGIGAGVVDITYAAGNDLFEGRRRLSGGADFTEVIEFGEVAAGWEPGEPFHSTDVAMAPKRSLWYEWQASVTGLQVIRLSGGDPSEPPYLAVYQGAPVSQLRQVVAGRGEVAFQVEEGQSYSVAIDSAMPQVDPLSLVFETGRAVVPGFDEWIASFDLCDLGLAADPDGDGFANILEFALGMAPDQFDVSGVVDVHHDGEGLSLVYARPEPPREGVEYFYEVSDDLENWRRLSPGDEFQETAVVDGEKALVRVTLSELGAAHYVRLGVATE